MRHTIKKQIFDLELKKGADAFALQQRVSDRFYMDILPEMEECFDELARPDQTIRIDLLQIDLGSITEEMIENGEWAQVFREELHKKMTDALAAVSVNEGGTMEPAAETSFEQWLYFIRNGYLPWNAARPSEEWLAQVLESLAGNYRSAAQLRGILSKEPALAQRIVLHHSPELLSHLVELLTAEKQDLLPAAIAQLAEGLSSIKTGLPGVPASSSKKEIERKLWTMVLPSVAAETPGQYTEAIITRLLRKGLRLEPVELSWLTRRCPELMNDSEVRKAIENFLKSAGMEHSSGKQEDETGSGAQSESSAQSNKQESGEKEKTGKQKNREKIDRTIRHDEETGRRVAEKLDAPEAAGERTYGQDAAATEEGIYIPHAGLVLLHPFLHTFFKKRELVKNGEFVDPEKQERAICLLHELADSGTEVQEYNLVLAKLLCGWPLQKPVNTGIEFTDEEKEEAQNLLTAVIEQWEILKNSSPAALQQGFLQREGKLFFRGERWYLQVEKKPIDILLGRLPWMISMVKLPWMKHLLSVEWV
ncbi:MAG TPA: contractile injection system tape measure protein [Flavisolibacter sp.]|jgi:hypothetical protein